MQDRQNMQFQSLGGKDALEKEMATCSSILAWEIPWTEDPGGLYSTESQIAGHDWAHMHTHTDAENITETKKRAKSLNKYLVL